MNPNLKIDIERIKALCQHYKVRELALFGSAVTGDFNPVSDIDVLIEFEPGVQIGFVTLSKMQRELSGILERRVDLVPKAGLKPKIRESVLSSAEVLYAACGIIRKSSGRIS